MSFVLDVAAGVLIAAAVVGIVAFGFSILVGVPPSDGERQRAAGFWVITLGILLGIAIVVCRFLRWP
jgi:hypothetical protein